MAVIGTFHEAGAADRWMRYPYIPHCLMLKYNLPIQGSTQYGPRKPFQRKEDKRSLHKSPK